MKSALFDGEWGPAVDSLSQQNVISSNAHWPFYYYTLPIEIHLHSIIAIYLDYLEGRPRTALIFHHADEHCRFRADVALP